MSDKKINVFISYAHKDESFKEELEMHLKPLTRSSIHLWTDRNIEPGQQWDDEIKGNLKHADVLLFLISPAFMASDYIHNVEIEKALERYQQNKLAVVPIVIRPSDWSALELNKFQALPKNAQPISTWDDQDQAWLDVVKRLKPLFEKIAKKKVENPSSVNSNLGSSSSTKTNPNNSTPKSNIDKNVIKNLIGQGKVKAAFKMMNEQHDNLSKDVQNQIILLSGQFSKMESDSRMGILEHNQENVQRARIINSLLSLIDEL